MPIRRTIIKADSSLRAIRLISLVIQEGFEPPTHGLEERRLTLYLIYNVRIIISYKKSLIFSRLPQLRNLLSALPSIWRIRSRVTLKCCPTSSRVLGLPSFKPKRK